MTGTIDETSWTTVTRIAFAALIAGGVALGFSGIFVRFSDTGPVAGAFYRMAIATPVFLVWARLLPAGAPAAGADSGVRANLGLLALAGAFFGLDMALFHVSISLTTVANASLLSNLSPIWVTFGAWLIYRERIRPLFLLGLVVALAGCVVLMGHSLQLSEDRLLGDAVGALASVFYGSYLLCLVRLRARISTAALMAASSFFSAAVLLPLAFLVEGSIVVHSLAGWAALVGLALVSQTAGQGLIAYAFAHLPASFSSVSLLVQPVAAAVLAWVILGEALGPLEMLGGAIVLAGIWVAARASQLGGR